jgi:type II secretory pathway pseudopilin PulG
MSRILTNPNAAVHGLSPIVAGTLRVPSPIVADTLRVPSPIVAGALRVPSLSAAGVPTFKAAWATFTRETTINRQGGYGTRSVPATNRRGVTLVELLVVILIMLLITAVTVPAIAPSMKNRDVREAARMIDVFINGARTRAQQTGHSYGVMIERMPGQPNGSVTLSYCEQPDAYTGDYTSSTIQLLGNGSFGAWAGSGSPGVIVPVAFPMSDTGWLAGPAPSGTGWLTNIAPGDVMVVKGQSFRIWAGEPFIDIDQNGICNVTAALNTPGYLPGTPPLVQEPFLDADGSFSWTPPNPAPGQPGHNATQPYVDPASGYFVQPNVLAGSPFPVMTAWAPPNAQSAFVTYAPFDPVQAATTISNAYIQTAKGNLSPYMFSTSSVLAPPSGLTLSFSFLRRPIKTSAPSIQLPGGAVIDLGANLPYLPPGQQIADIIRVPGSGIEVLAANANSLALWATFDCNPLLDPALNGLLVGVPAQNEPPSDPTPIIITFMPTGTVDKVYSWSEINSNTSSGTSINWTDWQGRIPAGPIYLLVGRQELINGDPDLLPLIAQNLPPISPVFNVQDPSALWVVINPQTGAVATAENVGYDLTSVPVSAAMGGPTFNNMFIYWNANVYYARRLARAMLDMGGR